MGSERFYEKEMVSESDASYNSLSPDGSLTLSPGGSPKPKSSFLSDASSSPERLAELGIPSEIDEGVCTVGTMRSLWKKEACPWPMRSLWKKEAWPWPTEDRVGVPFGRRTTSSHDSLDTEWAR